MNRKNIPSMIGIGAVACLWLGVSVYAWFKPVDDISESERRKLAQFPEFSANALLNSSFTSDLEAYTLDQFPYRDALRTVKAGWTYFVCQQKDNNGYYISNQNGNYYIAEKTDTLNEASINNACDKFNTLYEQYLKNDNTNIYISVVPDKSYLLADCEGIPAMDYEKLFQMVQTQCSFATYIDITPLLSIEDYYQTDTHWKQEQITDIAGLITDQMNASDRFTTAYNTVKTDQIFHGVYYGQAALPIEGDSITYLSNPVIEDCSVYLLETDETLGIYNEDKLNSRDPYEFYLSGNNAIVEITNPNAAPESGNLIIFRDSFGSSIAPLLCEGYEKITLIDIRYINSSLLGDYVNFNADPTSNTDVLFLYSTLVLNNSTILK